MTEQLATLLKELRSDRSQPAFRLRAHVQSRQIYRQTQRNRLRFWADRAAELEWFKPWRKILDWNPPHAKWFVGGKLNASVNCLDRHVRTATRNKVALLWEGEPGDRRALSYWELPREVAGHRIGTMEVESALVSHPAVAEAAVVGKPHELKGQALVAFVILRSGFQPSGGGGGGAEEKYEEQEA